MGLQHEQSWTADADTSARQSRGSQPGAAPTSWSATAHYPRVNHL
jgi:hypothetical protein